MVMVTGTIELLDYLVVSVDYIKLGTCFFYRQGWIPYHDFVEETAVSNDYEVIYCFE